VKEIASIFSITTATNNIPIGKKRTATVLFIVTNTSEQPLTGRAVLVADPPDGPQAAWLQFQPPQKSERRFDAHGVHDYIVEVNVPVDALAGEYLFHLDMLDVDNPDESYTAGPTVLLRVAAPQKKEEKKPFPWWIIAVAVGVLAVAGVAIFWPRDPGKIACVAEDDLDTEIYVMNADGSNAIRLTNNGALDLYPAWSPDESSIAFASDPDGLGFEIYVMNAADGSNQINLTNNNAPDFSPTWSPDGGRIAFVSRRDGNNEIYVMDAADGSNLRKLTSNNVNDSTPAWSPDGRRIAFVSNRDGNNEIYVMDAADGSNLIRLTTSDASEANPDWSPNGRRITFDSYRDGHYDIYVMNADGSKQRSLTTDDAFYAGPTWSPNGRRIAFSSERGGIYGIYVMNADGSNLTSLAPLYGDPAWSR
jgi:Tol biopolymer transport system component